MYLGLPKYFVLKGGDFYVLHLAIRQIKVQLAKGTKNRAN